MKHFLWLLLLAASTAFTQSSVTLTWQANPAWATSWPTCSATVTKSCLINYTLSGSGPVSGSVAVPITAVSYVTPSAPPGTYLFTLVVNGKDQNGNPATSTPVTATATITAPATAPPPPINFKVTP